MADHEQIPSFTDDGRLKDHPGPLRTFDVWRESKGWCSACCGQDRPVVLFGHRDGMCHGICAFCLARVADVMRGSPSGGDPR
jgi:hypothetical protein